MSKEIDLSRYLDFYEETKGTIYAARLNCARGATRANIIILWILGKLIAARQEQYGMI